MRVHVRQYTAPRRDLLAEQVPPLPAPEKAGLGTKVGRLARELRAAMQAGIRIRSRAGRRACREICAACTFYDRAGNWGLGECQAPGCGCTDARYWLASTSCKLPVPRWGPEPPPRPR